MRLVLKADAKVNQLSFKKGVNEVPEWCVASLQAAGLVEKQTRGVVEQGGKQGKKKREKKPTTKRAKKVK